jgi:hypothetical protein
MGCNSRACLPRGRWDEMGWDVTVVHACHVARGVKSRQVDCHVAREAATYTHEQQQQQQQQQPRQSTASAYEPSSTMGFPFDYAGGVRVRLRVWGRTEGHEDGLALKVRVEV